jgi:hypothetical protein
MSEDAEKVITITVREDDFDVKCNSVFTKGEIYTICVSIIQHLEDSEDIHSSFSAPSMLQ